MTKTSTASKIQWTPKQREALALLRREDIDHVMLYGGARSGKTYLLLSAVVHRALRYPNSRHLVARLRFAYAKMSLWLDTLRSVLNDQIPPTSYSMNESDHYVKFNNGSEVWIDGLDDKDRVDKILGREYVTIYFNEISQIPYDTVTTVLTRLSQMIPDCIPKAYYDLNPAGNLHWAKRLFIDGITPDHEPVDKRYGYLLINPKDNEENLPPRYIDDILSKLPKHKRDRFRDGIWSDPEGTIFTEWKMITEIPDEVKLHSRRAYGLDFGFSVDPAALIDMYINGDDIWIDELLYSPGLTNQMLAACIKPLLDPNVLIYADSAEPKSIVELQREGLPVMGVSKGADSVRVGIDWLLSKTVHVTERSANIWNEQNNYTWKTDSSGRALPIAIDDFNHAIDAMRYAGMGVNAGGFVFV